MVVKKFAHLSKSDRAKVPHLTARFIYSILLESHTGALEALSAYHEAFFDAYRLTVSVVYLLYEYSSDGTITWVIFGGLVAITTIVALLSLARSAKDITYKNRYNEQRKASVILLLESLANNATHAINQRLVDLQVQEYQVRSNEYNTTDWWGYCHQVRGRQLLDAFVGGILAVLWMLAFDLTAPGRLSDGQFLVLLSVIASFVSTLSDLSSHLMTVTIAAVPVSQTASLLNMDTEETNTSHLKPMLDNDEAVEATKSTTLCLIQEVSLHTQLSMERAMGRLGRGGSRHPPSPIPYPIFEHLTVCTGGGNGGGALSYDGKHSHVGNGVVPAGGLVFLRVAPEARCDFQALAPRQLLRMLMGQLVPDSGYAAFNPLMHVQMVSEVPSVVEGTLRENLLMGSRTFRLSTDLQPKNVQLWNMCKKVGVSTALLGPAVTNEWARLPMTNPGSLNDHSLDDLRKLALVRALLQRPDVLVLSQLGKGASKDEIHQLEEVVRQFLNGSIDDEFRPIQPCRQGAHDGGLRRTTAHNIDAEVSPDLEGAQHEGCWRSSAWRSVLWFAPDAVIDIVHKDGDATLTLQGPKMAHLDGGAAFASTGPCPAGHRPAGSMATVEPSPSAPLAGSGATEGTSLDPKQYEVGTNRKRADQPIKSQVVHLVAASNRPRHATSSKRVVATCEAQAARKMTEVTAMAEQTAVPTSDEARRTRVEARASSTPDSEDGEGIYRTLSI